MTALATRSPVSARKDARRLTPRRVKNRVAPIVAAIDGSPAGWNASDAAVRLAVDLLFQRGLRHDGQVFGDVSRFDEQTTEGSLTSGTLLITYGVSGRLVGALTVGASDELETELRDLIADHAPTGALERELVAGRSQ